MKLENKHILLVVLIIAACLRFYNYFEIPFTHDELSAMIRLNFDSFSDLIEKGVKIDGHPAGIHVFLYYWTHIFGFQEWMVKFPFTVFGILSVYFVYLLGKKWFNPTVGLLSSGYMASIQFMVMHSQIARPYASGLFFSLLMLYYWSNLMMDPQKNFYRNLLLFVISVSLCTYNHHFSLLLAFIVSVSGLFIIQREYLFKYILSGFVIFLLYIPHLKIFLYQLKIGGVGGASGWLGKPQDDFLIKFLCYCFNFSSISLILTTLIFLFALFYSKKLKDRITIKFVFCSFLWFIFPIVVGFFYSHEINPVLQYSVLIFSFPLLFFCLFGFINNLNPRVNLFLTFVILATNSISLIYCRKHYHIFYESSLESILTDSQSIKNKNIEYIIHSDIDKSKYLINKLGLTNNFIFYDEKFKNTEDFKTYLDSISEKRSMLYLGCSSNFPSNHIPLIRDYYPKIEMQNNYFKGTTYLFSKNKSIKTIISSLDFEDTPSLGWDLINSKRVIYTDSTESNKGYHFFSDDEWGPQFSVPLEDVIIDKNNFIDISLDVNGLDSLSEVILVATIESDSKNIYWGGTDFKDYITTSCSSDQWQKIHHSIQLSDVKQTDENLILKVFVWNKSRSNFLFDNIELNIRIGNPYLYGLVEEI